MRLRTWMAAITLAASGALACGDGQPSNENEGARDTQGGLDTTERGDTIGPADTAVAADVVAVDSAVATDSVSATDIESPPADVAVLCQPNPCTTPPPSGCSVDRGAETTYAAVGDCTVVSGAEQCDYAPGPCTLCSGGPCLLGACFDLGGDRCAWPYTDRVSYISEIRFQGEPACCHDFDGDAQVDNHLGTYLAQIAPVIGDWDDYLANEISGNHNMNLLLDFMGLDEPLTDPINDPFVDVIGYEANFDGEVFVEPATGNAELMLKMLSFITEESFMPRDRAVARIDQGHITASDGRLAIVNFGFDDAKVELLIEDMHFEGDVSVGPNGRGLVLDGDGGRGARLWGRVARKSLLDWMNAEFHWGCCTVYAEEDHRYPLDPATATCNTAVTPCSEEAGLCAALTDPDTCESLMALLDLDIDSDGDGENDAMSVGLHFKATSARIGWIEGCGPAPTDPNFVPH